MSVEANENTVVEYRAEIEYPAELIKCASELDVVSCGEVLAPIPGERWVCVSGAGHDPDDHIAEDGTTW